MNRETRNNLIFIAILMALILPGGVILVRKKSQPGERPIGSPDPVRKITAWIDPYPGNSMERIIPLKTLQWIGSLALEQDEAFTGADRISRPGATTQTGHTPTMSPGSGHVGAASPYESMATGPVDAQVMSDGLWFQAISRGPAPKPWVRLIIWDDDADPARQTLTASTQILRVRRIEMPKEIRHDLQDAGLILPPNHITLLEVAAPMDTPARISLTLAGARPRTESLTLP